jgi:ADP-ribose pyrophosphatase
MWIILATAIRYLQPAGGSTVPENDKTLLETPRFKVQEVVRHNDRGQEFRKAVIRHPGAVVILPFVEADAVCLIRNFRISVQRSLLELPAGTLEPGEDPAQAAIRELREETGYRAESWHHLHTFYPSPGVLDERMHLYLARQLTYVGCERQPDEDIENVIVPWSEALRLVRTRQIDDAKTIVGLLLYEQL